jgi:hypothetical protein
LSESIEVEWASKNYDGFGSAKQEDEFLHPEFVTTNPAYSLTETYYFNFNVIERNLVGEIYLWVHGNLNMSTAGVWIWQGFKRHHFYAEHFNVHNFLPMPILRGDTISLKEIGLSFTIVKPLQTVIVRYHDAATGTRLEMTCEAASPVAMRGNNKHFEQVMRNTGELKLAGETISIDCFTVRDRSWGEARPEASAISPPLTWAVGTFDGARMAFNLNCTDDPARGPDWKGRYDVPDNLVMRDGWIFTDQELRKVKRISKITTRDPAHMMRPILHDFEFADDKGRVYQVTGETISSLPWSVWHNLHTNFCLTRWTLNGTVGFGDVQDFYWKNYLQGPS